MTAYLISTTKKHSTVAHLLAPDGVHALCTYKPGEKTWPSVDGNTAGGKWILSENSGGLVCSVCMRKENPPPARPLTTTYLERKRARKRAEELARLHKWNEAARMNASPKNYHLTKRAK